LELQTLVVSALVYPTNWRNADWHQLATDKNLVANTCRINACSAMDGLLFINMAEADDV
jgi:hypothetical protein